MSAPTAKLFPQRRFRRLTGLIIACGVAAGVALRAEPVGVRHAEGLLRGFLLLQSLDGVTLADGDLIQTVSGDRVTTRLVFHFKDGSTHDETAVFTQRQQFRLVSDHLIQRGPSFPDPIDMAIDAVHGQVTVRYRDDNKDKVDTKRLTLPPDLSNGLIPIVLKNVSTSAPPKTLSYVAATPSPRLVKLQVSNAGVDKFTTGSVSRSATHYVLKVDLGGVAGVVAPLIGKQPPDSHVWILEGEAPAFIRSDLALYPGGPICRIELVSPAWPKTDEPAK